MSSAVVDASAVLALLNQEPGGEHVSGVIEAGAAISAVNFSEIVSKLSEIGRPQRMIHDRLSALNLEVIAFDSELAYTAGFLRPLTSAAELSLGDRACLALAMQRQLPAVTADSSWQRLSLGGVTVQLIR